jgi:hypothetical protein
MQMTDLLKDLGALQSVARELGISEREAASGAEALAPALLGGFKKQAQAQPSGLEGLAGVLGRLGGGSLLEDVLAREPTHLERGNDVLGQIFGSKEVSRAVAQNAAGKTGLDPALLKKMLPMLAMLLAGYMSRQGTAAAGQKAAAQQAGGRGHVLAGLLGSLLGGRAGGAAGAQRSAGLAELLDLDKQSNPLDDIVGMVGKLMR